MRVLVLGDLHGNPWALRAVDAAARAGGPVDAVLCTGDLVDYGPSPKACVDWVRRYATACVRGNHDHNVAQRVPPPSGTPGGGGLRDLAAAARPRQWDELTAADLRYLARLPVTDRVTLVRTTFLLVHGSPADPLDDYAPACPDGWSARLAEPVDVVLCGHTHVPYTVRVADGPAAGALVVNPGSVGQPRDGDPRASYATIELAEGESPRVTHHRVAYETGPAVAEVTRCGLPAAEKELFVSLVTTGRKNRHAGSANVATPRPANRRAITPRPR